VSNHVAKHNQMAKSVNNHDLLPIRNQMLANLQAIMRLHKIKNSKHKFTHHIQNTSQLSTHLLNPYIHNIKKSNHIQIVYSRQAHTQTLTIWFDSQHQKIKPYSNNP
jgi:hypothetical protein